MRIIVTFRDRGCQRALRKLLKQLLGNLRKLAEHRPQDEQSGRSGMKHADTGLPCSLLTVGSIQPCKAMAIQRPFNRVYLV